MNNIITAFSASKEWSDLMQVISDLNANLKRYGDDQNVNFNNLKDKIQLSKRLAQCLNPSLPAGLHENALQAYYSILKNIMTRNNKCLGINLALYSSGLFPFFQNASINNKILYLDTIVKGIFLELSHTELEVCLSGLLVSILPALEEQNDKIISTIKDIFDKIIHNLSREVFFGCLWSIIIRNKRLRQPGMKYILESVPSYETFKTKEKSEKENIIRDYYPKFSSMIINSLCSIIEDDDLPSTRLAMDFIIKCLPVHCEQELLTDEEKVKLLISCLGLLVKNEYSTTRRLSTWILGSNIADDELDLETPETKYKIKLLIEAFKIIFSVDNYKNVTKLIENLKTIEQFLNQLVSLSDKILENISIDIINCVIFYWEKDLNESENLTNNKIINKTQAFFNKDQTFIELLWESLAKNLSNLVNTLPSENEIKPIQIYEKDIIKAVKSLKFCLIYLNVSVTEDKIKYYMPIISNLLKIVNNNYEINSREDFRKIFHIIFIALVYLKSFQEVEKKNSIPGLSKNLENIMTNFLVNSLENLYPEKMGDLELLIKRFVISQESQFENLKSKDEFNSLLKDFTENIANFQTFYIKILNQLLQIDKKAQISRKEMKIFKYATEIIIRTQEYDPMDEVPEWLIYLEKIIFSGNLQLSLEAADYLLDLLSIDLKGNVYNAIKYDIKNKELDESIIELKQLEYLIAITKVTPNCCETLMAYLWILLKDQENQKKVIDLLIKFSKIDIDVFVNTISNTFANNEFEMNVNAIKIFTQFWKLTNEFYPNCIFFKNGECIFKMLDFLDNSHPLLRHLSKSWLNQSVSNFNKILDPLLSVLLSKDIEWKVGPSGKLLFAKEYDNKRVMDAFRKLKNIIINTTESAIKYFINNKSSKDLLEQDTLGTELEEIATKSIPRERYIGLLVSISLRFIQGKLMDGVEKSFDKENYSVNAASCEFLEFLLSFIEQKEELMKIAIYISGPVIDILYNAVDKNDEVMQVQLISLLKVLLIDTKEMHLEYKEFALQIFNNDILLLCLEKGIQISYFFVRGHFISFVEMCLPIFSKILPHKDLVGVALRLVQTTTEFLAHRVKYTERDKKFTHKFSHLNPDSEKFIVKNYLEEYKDYKDFDENDITIIVKGLKEIIFHFLKINKEEYNKYLPNKNSNKENEQENLILKNNWDEFKKDLSNSFKSSSSFGDYLVGLFSDKNFEENVQNEGIEKINKTIYEEKLADILSALLEPWINQSDIYEPRDYCLNKNGILVYPFYEINNSENETDINEEIGRIADFDNKKQVKSQIIEMSLFLFLKNPVDFMDKFLILWGNENKSNYDKQYKLSMIELLMNMKIPFSIILLTINRIIQTKQKYKYTTNKNKMYVIPIQKPDQITPCVFESKLCHFVYSYILLNNFEINKKNSINSPKEIWKEINLFIKNIFDGTKTSYTFCWLYEIINIMLVKFPLNLVKGEPEIKKDISDLFLSVNKKLTDVSFNKKFDSIYDESDFLMTPILPSIYTYTVIENYPKDNLYLKTGELVQSQQSNNLIIDSDENKKNEDENQFAMIGDVNHFYKEYYNLHLINKKLEPDILNIIYRKMSFLILRNNYLFIIWNIFNDRPNELVKLLNSIINKLITLMKTYQIKSEYSFYHELAVEFLDILMQNCTKATTSAGKQIIMDYFNDDSFFKTTPKVIKLWKNIINHFAEIYKDIIGDILNQMDFGVLFFKASNLTKVKMLRRISFIIYSCEKDRFTQKFPVLKEKVVELFTAYSEVSILESEIFLMMRVLFLRYSHDNIIDMIRVLWPIIFSELLAIINKEKKNSTIRLLFESLKFVELLSLANIEEFSLYQWIFIIDTFDINKLNPSEDSKSLLISLLNNKDKIFTPIAMNICSDKSWKSDENNYKGKNHSKSELIIVSGKHTTKGMEINEYSQMTEEELQALLKKFFYSIGDMNNYSVKVNYQQIEKVIEEDFLHDVSENGLY